MNHKNQIDRLMSDMNDVVVSFMELHSTSFQDGWIPITFIKDNLDLNKDSYPQGSKTQGKRGWFFAVLARSLEDQGRVEYKNDGKNSFCRLARK